jgi:16S rRNA (guanine(966)-N(2))-methyltransferase RsmD
MRVIGGTARGRRLAAFAGREIRPTPDRVREALFSILYSRKGPLVDGKVLDLFAGCGALGIEALSRGASHAWFVDNSRDAVGTIRDNLARCGFSDRATVILRDVREALSTMIGAGPFDVIFADPPYGRDHAAGLLAGIDRHRPLGMNGLVCLETAVSDPTPPRVGALLHSDQRRYGLTMLHFYHYSSEDQA